MPCKHGAGGDGRSPRDNAFGSVRERPVSKSCLMIAETALKVVSSLSLQVCKEELCACRGEAEQGQERGERTQCGSPLGPERVSWGSGPSPTTSCVT